MLVYLLLRIKEDQQRERVDDVTLMCGAEVQQGFECGNFNNVIVYSVAKQVS